MRVLVAQNFPGFPGNGKKFPGMTYWRFSSSTPLCDSLKKLQCLAKKHVFYGIFSCKTPIFKRA